jgi:GDP-L-fucose synthase
MSNSTYDWGKQHVIVTGAGGFLGRHVVSALEEHGAAEIIAPRSSDYDLREKEAAVALFADHPQATMVIHLAATAGGIGLNRAHPGLLIYNNLMMGTLILEQSRLAGIEKFVGMGTVCSYPKYTQVPFKEEDLWLGYPEETNAGYGLTKKMLMVQSQAYRAEYDFNAIHLLLVNLYGPGDNFDLENSHFTPALIRRMVMAKEQGLDHVLLWGDGSATRELLYVKDAAEGILRAAAYYDSSEPINLGSGMEISIRQAAETIAEMVGFTGEIRWDTSKPNGQPRRCLDVSRAEREFGFRAQTDFQAGLRETIDWYLSNREVADGLVLNTAQNT